jgi:proline iminopeptidase
VLTAVTTGARAEIDWITEGVGRIFPEAWEEFASLAHPDERVVEAYARAMRDTDPTVRARAALSWEAWESTHVSLDPEWTPGPMFDDARARENFATLVTHFWANDCFLERPVIEQVADIAHIPAVLIHGRRDISGPAITPWKLHRALPGSELHIVEEEGHGGEREMEFTCEAIDRLA